MKVAIVGATGMVGAMMIQVLEERNFPVTTLIPIASRRSIGKHIFFQGKNLKVIGVEEAILQEPDLVFFSAGGNISKKWALQFAETGAKIIDNSSYWRMSPNHKLIVPEINGNILTKEDTIIANPNCSTIQLVIALSPLHEHYKIKRVVVSTYQSITGTGAKAVQQLSNERNGISGEKVYPHPIYNNVLPHCDVFEENGYTKEEMKLSRETKKIMQDEDILVSATAVRVPVKGGHSESVNVEFEKAFEVSKIFEILKKSPGIVVEDNPKTDTYPMPLTSANKDGVFVGRIRRDFTKDNTLNMWIVSDNLRKGASTNAIQIAEVLVNKEII